MTTLGLQRQNSPRPVFALGQSPVIRAPALPSVLLLASAGLTGELCPESPLRAGAVVVYFPRAALNRSRESASIAVRLARSGRIDV